MALRPTGFTLAPGERDPARFVSAIRQLAQGRSDAVGSVTLATGVTTTVVPAPNCGLQSAVFLSPQTASAAAAIPTTYPSNVGKRQFTITHTSSAAVDRTFWWVCLG